LQNWPESDQYGRNLASMTGIWSICRNPVVVCQISANLAKIQQKWPNFGHLHHKLVN
jgi:hypothetical protein